MDLQIQVPTDEVPPPIGAESVFWVVTVTGVRDEEFEVVGVIEALDYDVVIWRSKRQIPEWEARNG